MAVTCGRTAPHGPHGYAAPIDPDNPPVGVPQFFECEGVPDETLQPAEQPEAVDHPAYYGGADNPYEAIKVIRAWDLGFNLGNTVKYISRAGRKDPAKYVEDLEKALWYLQDEIRSLKA